MSTDLTFITNEQGKSLKERFNVLIRDARFFDALSGYFYTSGFYAIYQSLENTEKIRIFSVPVWLKSLKSRLKFIHCIMPKEARWTRTNC